MGLKNWLHNKRMSDPVAGSYQLSSCSANSGGAVYENCSMHGVVSGPGVGPVAVAHTCTAPTKRWPQPGQTLPVTVDRTDPTRLQIEWDQLPTNADRGQQVAEQIAASMRGEPTLVKHDVSERTFTVPTGDAAQISSLLESFVKQAEAQGAHVTTNVHYSVIGKPGQAMPGVPGGGLTPEQAAAAASAPGMQSASARVLAVHEVAVPAGMPGGGAAGTVDLTLDITPQTGEGWSATTRISFSTAENRARVATVGAVLPVFVNPQAHDQVAIDITRLNAG